MRWLNILLLILVIQINYSSAQISNGGFEIWVQESNYERPADWITNQDSVYRRIEKDTVAVEGNYSLKFVSEVTDPFEGCESSAYTVIPLNEPLPSNSVLEFYVKVVPMDDSTSELVFLRVITALRKDGPVISNNVYESFIPIQEFTKVELPLTNEPADVLEIGISGAAISSPTDGPCLRRSTTWIDGMNIRSDITGTTSVLIQSSDISVFPNPSHGSIDIRSKSDQHIQYELYSNIGQLVEIGKINGSSLNIDEPGTYFLKLIVGQGNHQMILTKFIVVI